MRADLHVHSCHSTQSGSLRFLRSRDCYSATADVYHVARARGMDIVTITDHDSIDGCLEFLSRHPNATDFIAGEEVSCRFPDGDIEVHIGVYGMTESLHRELQPLRRNVFEVTAFLRQEGVCFALNHLMHFYRGQAPLEFYLRLVQEVPAIEARNGAMLPIQNLFVESLAARAGTLGLTGGSDAHTLRRIGTTWTEVPGALTAAEFLAGLAQRKSRVGGLHGGVLALSGDVYGVVGRYLVSLAGLGPSDHHGMERLVCAAFSLLSLPFQFMPLVVAALRKSRERREVARALRILESIPAVPSPVAAQGVE